MVVYGYFSAQPVQATSTLLNVMLPESELPWVLPRSPFQPALPLAMIRTRVSVQLLRRPAWMPVLAKPWMCRSCNVTLLESCAWMPSGAHGPYGALLLLQVRFVLLSL